VRVLKYSERHYTLESAGNQKESNMYTGGGLLLVLIAEYVERLRQAPMSRFNAQDI